MRYRSFFLLEKYKILRVAEIYIYIHKIINVPVKFEIYIAYSFLFKKSIAFLIYKIYHSVSVSVSKLLVQINRTRSLTILCN